MKLTKKLRLEAYRWAMSAGPTLVKTGVCFALQHHVETLGVYTPVHNAVQMFPEFLLFAPNEFYINVGEYWFDSNSERLTCLAFCIAMCE